ncbi:uncharacterized protein LOC110986518 isoform X2 [Acanthaster planci]|uniref:Uncharacterized protein LOC110986518 isoform X2 n=1 Tax=Acanthaster planci TaxID=133434 RepID=A0A8B7ZGK1_ACAPL|nr:uncharacterized protein LOC110986518 isoform X2 [Acanthaster planci]
MVRDINPRALFTWTLGDQELPSSNVSDITGTNGLLTSTSLVTMSPLWANHEEWLRCRATNREDHAGSDIAVTLDVKVLPTVISIYKNTTNATYTSEKSLLIEGVESTFTCEVPNVRPAASITWTLGSLTIESTGNKDLLGINGLTTSTSYVKLLPSWGYHGEVLKCSASNVDGFREVNASVTLDVNVPPQKSSISLLDSEGFKLRDSVDVDEGITYAFTCVVQVTRPAATIEWFLDGVLQDTVSPTDGQVDELVNTTGNWSLTPAKENHGQEVRCTASTPESEEPFPGRTVSLNVLVLPKRVFLFDASGTLSSANTAYLIAGVDHWFACIVQDINPGAWFIWTLGDQELNSNKVHEVVDTNGLINSTGVLTILPTVVKHREVLRCRAINREGHMGSSASVVLDVKDVQSIKSGLIVGIVIVGVATVVSIVIIARCIYIRNSAANLTQGRKDATPEVSVEDEEEKDIPTEGSGKAEIPMQVMTSDEGIEPSGWIE